MEWTLEVPGESPFSGLEWMVHAFGQLLDLISLQDTSSAVIISSLGLLIYHFFLKYLEKNSGEKKSVENIKSETTRAG